MNRLPPVRCLVLALLSAGVVAADGAAVQTPFEVRTEVKEWLEDLARRTGSSDDGSLIERARQVLARHADRMIEDPASPGNAVPVAELIPRSLAAAGLDRRFAETVEVTAARRLAEATDPTALRGVARGFPGTGAAREAWARLALGQWDRGGLASFLGAARRAGLDQGPGAERVAAARTLLRPPSAAVPSTLDGLDALWNQAVELRAQGRGTVRRALRTIPGEAARPRARIGLSTPQSDLMCASDGLRAIVFDHLMGRVAGPAVTVGNAPLSLRQARPVPMPGGFAVVGVEDSQRIALTALGRDGGVRWRSVSAGLGFNPLVSAPLLVDHALLVAVVVSDEDAAELRLLAMDQGDGHPLWDARIARLGGSRAWMSAPDAAATVPVLCRQGGTVLVLSNAGVLARVAMDGLVERVWTYRGADDAGRVLGRVVGSRRSGSMAGDGELAVVTPADLPDQALIVDGDSDPVSYHGDGAGGEAVAAADGCAWLVASRVVALDLRRRLPRWDRPAPAADGDLQAAVGGGTLVVAGSDAVAVYATEDGTERARRHLERPVGLGVGDHTLVFAGDGDNGPYLAAFGAANDLAGRLAEAARSDPTDTRSTVALASLAEGRGRSDEALAWYEESLRRGADATVAAKAARLVRRMLEHAAGEAWDPALARFAILVGRDPGLAAELEYWRGRRAEGAGDSILAGAQYRAARDGAGPAALVEGPDGVAVHVTCLAEAGIARVAPPVSASDAPAPAAGTLASWSRPARRGGPFVVGGGMAVGYADGVLSAVAVEDGSERWWRTPLRPLLGVRSRPEQVAAGVSVDIMPGTSAAAAGLRSGDVLVRFNGREIRNFSADLVPTVMALTVRSPFTAEIQREGRDLTIQGVLGGEMVEPVAANDRTVLVWPTLVGPVGAGLPTLPGGGRPEGMWVAIHDLISGRELWRHGLPPLTQTSVPPRPLLSADDQVVVADGGDLLAYPAHGGPQPSPTWRLPGLGSAQASLLDDGRHLWLTDAGGTARLVEAASGRILARLALTASAVPVRSGHDLLVRADDGGLACLDLGYARMRWRVAGIARLVAVNGDMVWAVNAADQMVALDRFSGAVRRLYGDWVGIDGISIGGGRLYVAARPTATSHTLACVSLAGGSVLWQQALPRPCIAVDGAVDGVAVALADGPDGMAILGFAADGRVRRALLDRSLGQPLGVRQVAGGAVLVSGPGGLRRVDEDLPAPGPTIPCRRIDDPSRLVWQQIDGVRYAWSSSLGGRQLWIDAGTTAVEVRMAALGGLVVGDPLSLQFPGDGGAPTLPAGLTAEAVSLGGRRGWRVLCPATVLGEGPTPWQVDVRIPGTPRDDLGTWLQRQWRTVVDLP